MTSGKPSVQVSFRVAPGARIRKADAKVLGEAFEKLKSSGPLTADRVLSEAMNARSPLHRYFEWDDGKAAHQFRLEQARRLVRSIEIVLEDAKGKQVPMKAYYSVKDSEGQRGYETMQFVFSSPDLADQIIEEAHAQLEAWKVKYARYAWAKAAIPKVSAALRAIKTAKKAAKKKPAKAAA
jgi:hypothetical protein